MKKEYKNIKNVRVFEWSAEFDMPSENTLCFSYLDTGMLLAIRKDTGKKVAYYGNNEDNHVVLIYNQCSFKGDKEDLTPEEYLEKLEEANKAILEFLKKVDESIVINPTLINITNPIQCVSNDTIYLNGRLPEESLFSFEERYWRPIKEMYQSSIKNIDLKMRFLNCGTAIKIIAQHKDKRKRKEDAELLKAVISDIKDEIYNIVADRRKHLTDDE